MRMRRKRNLEPRMQRCAGLWIQDPEAYRGSWREKLMPESTGLYLELGCGKGRFTCESAAAMPERLFVAVERVPDAMVIAMERAAEMELPNVFFVDADATSVVLSLPCQTVDADDTDRMEYQEVIDVEIPLTE